MLTLATLPFKVALDYKYGLVLNQCLVGSQNFQSSWLLTTYFISREWMVPYQDHGDVRESVVGLADVVEPGFVNEYFL